MERLASEKFDMAIGECMDHCFYGIVRRAGIPKHISVFTTQMYPASASILGLPALPSFLPGFIETTPNMTYWQRAQNLVMNVLSAANGKEAFLAPIERVIQRHVGEDFDAVVSYPSCLHRLGKNLWILLMVSLGG